MPTSLSGPQDFDPGLHDITALNSGEALLDKYIHGWAGAAFSALPLGLHVQLVFTMPGATPGDREKVAAYLIASRHGTEVIFQYLATDKDAQGNGLAQALMRAALDRLSRAAPGKIKRLMAKAQGPEAIGFFTRRGFRHIGGNHMRLSMHGSNWRRPEEWQLRLRPEFRLMPRGPHSPAPDC